MGPDSLGYISETSTTLSINYTPIRFCFFLNQIHVHECWLQHYSQRKQTTDLLRDEQINTPWSIHTKANFLVMKRSKVLIFAIA